MFYFSSDAHSWQDSGWSALLQFFGNNLTPFLKECDAIRPDIIATFVAKILTISAIMDLSHGSCASSIQFRNSCLYISFKRYSRIRFAHKFAGVIGFQILHHGNSADSFDVLLGIFPWGDPPFQRGKKAPSYKIGKVPRTRYLFSSKALGLLARDNQINRRRCRS